MQCFDKDGIPEMELSGDGEMVMCGVDSDCLKPN